MTEILVVIETLLNSNSIKCRLIESANKITVSTMDKRKCPLKGEIIVMETVQDNPLLVYFKKSKGDPLEFKRMYKVIYEECKTHLDVYN